MQEIEPGYSVDSWMQSLYHLGLIANIFAILLMVCGLVWFIYLRKEGNFREIKWKGRRLLFVSIVVVPFFVLLIGHFYAADVSKKVSFCGSCHVVQSYVKDMINPTSISLAARHYDRAVINENQCRACHEKYYGIKGDAFARLTGSRHALKYIWWEARKIFTGNNYEFNIEVPSKLSLNSNCLNCHGRSIKSFFHIIDHGLYRQKSVRKRIEALFLDNIGKILSREQIIKAATDPKTGREPENWHQRLSELRTDDGYTILSWRNRGDLKVQEYLMPHRKKRRTAGKRVRPSDATWLAILKRADYACEWNEAGQTCGLKDGDIDPIGGGRAKLTPDHKNPHSLNPETDPKNKAQWQALCGRHQVTKKNYWNSATGKLNTYAIVQFAPQKEKSRIFNFLLKYFGYKMLKNGQIKKGDK